MVSVLNRPGSGGPSPSNGTGYRLRTMVRKVMRFCVDIQSAVAQRAGVGRYTHKLVQHLGPIAAASGDELRLFHFDFKRKGRPFPVEGATFAASRLLPGRVVQQSWKRFGCPAFDRFAGPADLYHFPNFVRPPLRRGASVVTIHDLSFLKFPETMEEKNFRYQNAKIRETVRDVDAVITDAAAIADEVSELLDVPRAKVHPIHLGLEFAAPTAEQTAAFRKARGIERPYLLHLGTLEPRKNHRFLFDVFEALEASAFDGDLVLAGMQGWKCEPILERIAANPRIRYLSFVPDEDLPTLYAGAEAFVFPSLYEGFGFPPLEAMACGTPVVSSAAGSLAEVLGPAATVVDAFEVDAWTAAISDTLGTRPDPAWLEQYQWQHTAEKTWALYQSLLA